MAVLDEEAGDFFSHRFRWNSLFLIAGFQLLRFGFEIGLGYLEIQNGKRVSF